MTTQKRTITAGNVSVDVLCALLLAALCWMYNWRLMTANPLDQQSMVEGDFSGQFVAFAHYQAVRFAAGQVPLWNPYNLGGHPFLADTQSAVFYPPRLVTIALVNLGGGSTPGRMYAALQLEMVAHMLIAALLMYAFVRRLMPDEPYSYVGGVVGGIVFAFGGYMTAYPQLQLAIMEAGVWLPLALLGIHEATRHTRPGWRWFGLAGVALALSLLAGHPQTTLFFGYAALAYLGWRTLTERRRWHVFAAGAAVFGLVGLGLAAVQVLPAWEYQSLTTRGALSFDAKGSGFPFYDVLQILFPGLFSLWSPLYFGILSLMLIIYSAWRIRLSEVFWFMVAVVALALSFGRETIVYDLFYNFAPGFSLFRGQERSAYLIAAAASVLAAHGAADILRDTRSEAMPRRFTVIYGGISAAALSLGAAVFAEWLSAPAEARDKFQVVMFSLLFSLMATGLLINLGTWRNPLWLRVRAPALVGLLIFELFSFGRANPNLESRPTAERLAPPPLVQAVQAARQGEGDVFRVAGVRENYGTLYGLWEVGGISPLRLTSIDRLLTLPSEPRAWEALAVRYVMTENRQLPVPSRVVASDPNSRLNLHQLAEPRPFARLVYRAWVEPDDAQARGILSEPAFDAKNTVILAADPGLPQNYRPGIGARVDVQVISAAPEQIALRTQSPAPALLNVALVYYPGWEATIDGQPTPLLRADIALTALVVPAGDHRVELTFTSGTYRAGSLISLITLAIVALGGLSGLAIYRVYPKTARRAAGA